MAREDKILEILSMAQLPLDVKIARLAHRWVGKPFDRAQAKAVVKCYLAGEGKVADLTNRLMDEKNRQERIRNDRQALADAAALRQKSPMLRYKLPGVRRKRIMDICKRTFGPAVKENFNEDALALMSLISGEDRWYQINWLEAGFKPLRSVLIEVVTTSATTGARFGKRSHNRFLLYKHDGRVLVAHTSARYLKEAWGGQLSPAFMGDLGWLRDEGWALQMDYQGQAMVASNGDHVRSYAWTGRTVDD